MSVLDQISSAQGLSDNSANIRLAEHLAASADRAATAKAIEELVAHLQDADRRRSGDCIKVLYEVGRLKPRLIGEHHAALLALLESRHQRMIWGGMQALASIAEECPQELVAALDRIIPAMNGGSVIASDAGVELLARLCALDLHRDAVEPLLFEHLWQCPIKQLPQYLEKAERCLRPDSLEAYLAVLDTRLPECTRESQAKRLQKIRKRMVAG